MSKPSIFSKDYKKRMKKRRRKILFVSIFIAILGAAIVFFVKNTNSININDIKNKITSIFNKKTVNNANKDIKKPDTTKNSNVIIDDVKDEKNYSIKLTDGTELKAIYEVNGGNKVFKAVSTVVDSDSSKFKYDINPDATKIVIFDINAQSILYINNEGVVNDITKKEYVADSTGNRFLKETVLKNTPNYIWASTPRFIDNENIAYISQLPWFRDDNIKYIWIVNVNTPNNHIVYENIKGINISFDKLVDKGLTIKIEENTKYLKANGTLVD